MFSSTRARVPAVKIASRSTIWIRVDIFSTRTPRARHRPHAAVSNSITGADLNGLESTHEDEGILAPNDQSKIEATPSIHRLRAWPYQRLSRPGASARPASAVATHTNRLMPVADAMAHPVSGQSRVPKIRREK